MTKRVTFGTPARRKPASGPGAGLLVRVSVGLVVLACGPEDESSPAAADVADAAETTELDIPPIPDIVDPVLPPLGGCTITPGAPAAGALVGSDYALAAKVTPKVAQNTIIKGTAFYWANTCDKPPADPAEVKKLPDIEAADFTDDGSFGWVAPSLEIPPYTGTSPLFEHPSPTVCIQFAAEVSVPEGHPDGTPAPTCSAQLQYQIDRECPAVLRFAPALAGEVGFEPYVAKLPFKLAVYDPSGIDWVRITTEAGEELQRFVPSTEGATDAEFEHTFDVSGWETGAHELTIESRDRKGNVCTRVFTSGELRPKTDDFSGCPLVASCALNTVSPNVVKKTSFLGPLRPPPAPGPIQRVSVTDIDGDSISDVLGLTGAGALGYYRGDGTGQLGEWEPLELGPAPIAFAFATQLNPNTDGLVDLVVVAEQEEGALLQAFVQVPAEHPSGGVCTLPTPDPIAGGIPELQCAPGWGLVDQHALPALPTAALFEDIAVDPALPESVKFDNRFDLVLGHKDDDHALAMVVAAVLETVEWESPAGDVVTMDACDYRPPTQLPDGAIVPPPPSRCFNTPVYFPGIGSIIALGASDLLEDSSSGVDIIASRDGPTRAVTIHRHNGRGAVSQAFAWGEVELPAAVTQIIAGQNSFDNDPKYDLMLVLPEAGQLWQIMGTGGSEFKSTGGAIPVTLHRAICVEGTPTSVVYEDIGGVAQVSGMPPAPPDILVANGDTGTLWTFMTRDLVDEGSNGTLINYDPPKVVGLGMSPVQIVLAHLDGDTFKDLVVLGHDGLVEVLLASNPDLPPTDPRFGPRGTFSGPIHVTTPIVAQSNRLSCSGGVAPTDCVEPWAISTSVASSVALGTPGNRLEPVQMVVRDFNGDAREDLVLVCSSAETGSECDASEAIERRIPVLPYHASSAPFFPTTPQPVNELNPQTAYCNPQIPADPPCAAPYWGPKGEPRAVVAGNFDFALAQDLIIATDTAYVDASCPEGNPLNPLDFLLNAQGQGTRFVQKEYSPGLDNTPIVECAAEAPPIPPLPGFWKMLGLQRGVASRPKALAALSCDKNNDASTDLVVLGERQAEYEGSIVRHDMVQVYKMGNGNLSDEGPIKSVSSPLVVKGGYFEIGKVTVDVFSGRVGKKHGAQPPATLKEVDGEDDFVVVTDLGVVLFEGRAGLDCNFVRIGFRELGTDIRGAAMADLDGDRYVDLIGARGDGAVTVAYGGPKAGATAGAYDSIDWAAPVVAATSVPGISKPQVTDVNSDGLTDLVVLGASALHAFLNTGLPAADAPNRYTALPCPIPVAPGTVAYEFVDFNDDGCLDVVTLSPEAKAAEIQHNIVPNCQ